MKTADFPLTSKVLQDQRNTKKKIQENNLVVDTIEDGSFI